MIRQGVERLKASGTDVILIDPQFAPKILAKADIGHRSTSSRQPRATAEVGLFHRFAVMRHWRESERIPFEQFLSSDGCT